MAQVLVRGLEAHVIDRYKARAAARGHSLEQELREVIIAGAALTGAEKLAIADRIRAMTPTGVLQTDSTELIRADRDSR